MNEQDLLDFIDDEAPSAPQRVQRPPWRILVVDDDADVHEGTEFGLRSMEIEDRPLELLHAYSGGEALDLLRREGDIAVILLDVVMESENAGLVVVDRIRGELGLEHVRIVLRTGQPGQAPEIETIQRYDINDYRSKADLTRVKLYTALTAAVRAYDQLLRLDASRRGLEKVVEASNQFLAEQGLQGFAASVIAQLGALLDAPPAGLFCAARRHQNSQRDATVLAAAGPFAAAVDRALGEVADPVAARSLARALRERRNLLEPEQLTLFFAGHGGQDFAAFVPVARPRGVDAPLMEVFCSNVALSAANIELLQRLRDYAFKDRLLDLPNRVALTRHIDQELAAGRAEGHALLLLDIDQFAALNDMFGYGYGDQLLTALARRLVGRLVPASMVARVAGDTFGVWGLAPALDPARLRGLLEQPFALDGVARPVSISMGLAPCDAAPASGQELFKNALIALKQAKAGGHGHVQVYTAEAGLAARERARLLHGLRQAFDHGQLVLAYQPQLALDSGRPIGAEALLRWRGEDGRFIPPDEFIPVAERSGLIVPIGSWVLRTALRALAGMQALAPGLRMAVNVSPLQFAQPQFLAQLDAALHESGLPPSCLELEVTESVAVMGLERAVELLQQVKARGIAVAIDDFGTGFSSLSYLDRLPADRLKIDRAFVSALDLGTAGARIAEMIVPLGRRLGMQVLAEGVETVGQAQALQQLGCDEVQGYLYARPMPLDSFMAWLAETRAA
ncbi:GGDEF/EAL domain-containing response regulator [Pseudorhodoferax sp.]|uniref:GGDEF/EAL domain-containing response regulator n=1 Tax=Pseudorhodoferax sp. TaxID=1993553 RepID=UPI002DD633BF|nr:EAL domain-containing protein [Pseudorhodoferax sp.]